MNNSIAKQLRKEASAKPEMEDIYTGKEVEKPYFVTDPKTLKQEMKKMPFVQAELHPGSNRSKYKKLKRQFKNEQTGV